MSTEKKVAEDIGNCVRQNIPWQQLPVHLRQVLHNSQRDYEKYVFNFSLKNQLRFRGNLASKVFQHEQRYYELLLQQSINGLSLFPYHLADIVTKGLRVTPFNYYLDVLSQLLRNDKSYDTLPNFTAADCLRVLGIGRNEYLALIGELKTNTTRALIFSSKPNPMDFLPRFPVRIRIEPWWRVELGLVLENDIRYVTANERGLIDDLIDFGGQTCGKCDYELLHGLYRKGLIYLDVPISGEDRICIPPLRNFVMNRVSGDAFESLLYKIFVSADEHMSIAELAQMLQVDLDAVKQAVSLFVRLGFAQLKEAANQSPHNAAAYHVSWQQWQQEQAQLQQTPPQITPLNYNNFVTSAETAAAAEAATNSNNNNSGSSSNKKDKDSSSIDYQSDGANSDFSFACMPATAETQQQQQQQTPTAEELSSELEELSISDNNNKTTTTITTKSAKEYNNSTSTPSSSPPQSQSQQQQQQQKPNKMGKRVGFLFDSTLTAFLMMGNLSPGLKNHAVTMFEVGKLCEESIDTFLTELEKVSLLDAEGEGDVSRYFAHAVILRSTICSLRNLLPGGLDLLRLECLESLDHKTRDRILDKKYKFIISSTPLTASLSHSFSIPFFGQFHRSCDSSHMWTKLFYNHISGYGPPSLFLCRGTVLKSLPRIFLGYGKLLVNILHSDAYVINTENFRNLNDQLRNGCVLLQGYGIRAPGELRHEAFPFDNKDARQRKWCTHNAVRKLNEHLNLTRHCGFITFLNTGVPDIGCDNYELQVRLRNGKLIVGKPGMALPMQQTNAEEKCLSIAEHELLSPGEVCIAQLEVSPAISATSTTPSPSLKLKSPDENYFANSPPQQQSPANVYTSADCSELLASEIAKCDANNALERIELVSQNSVEVTDAQLQHGSQSSIEEWTLLDVHFGVPLFDVDCNTRICEQIVRHLCSDENLAQLPAVTAEMNKTFLNFVRQCLYFEEELQEATFNTELLRLGRVLPQPRINLAFENGRVCQWMGR